MYLKAQTPPTETTTDHLQSRSEPPLGSTEWTQSGPHGQSIWPLSSRFYDPLTMNPELISNFVVEDTLYSDGNLRWFLEFTFLASGEMNVRRTDANESLESGVFDRSVLESPLTIIHVAQERLYFENYTKSTMSTDAPTWNTLLQKFEILPSFLELLHSNNGGSLVHVSYDRSQQTNESVESPVQAFHMGYKMGNCAIHESAIYARHDFGTDRVLVVLFGKGDFMRIKGVKHLLQGRLNPDPFHVVFSLLSRTLEAVEETRWSLDYQTQALESQTGISTFYNARGLEPLDPARLKFDKQLQVTAGWSTVIALASTWVRSNFEALIDHVALYKEVCKALPTCTVNSKGLGSVQNACRMKISLAEHQGAQTQQLQARLQAQLDITKTLIAQRDTQLNIELAEAAKAAGEVNLKIAEATMRDSQLMRGIAAVTMIFLPATFVATFFSMVFFHVGNESSVRLSIDRRIWLYPTITLPLTAIVTIWYWTRSEYLPWGKKQPVLHKPDSLAA